MASTNSFALSMSTPASLYDVFFDIGTPALSALNDEPRAGARKKAES
jgi:hypothetical protein